MNRKPIEFPAVTNFDCKKQTLINLHLIFQFIAYRLVICMHINGEIKS